MTPRAVLRRRRGRVAASLAGAALAVVLGAAGTALGPAAPAHAAPTTEIVQGRYLRIVSTADWSAAANLSDGAAVRWDLEVSAAAPEPGTMRIALLAAGTAGLVVDAALCRASWQGETCPDGFSVLRTDWAPPLDERATPLAAVPSDAIAHLRLEVRLDPQTVGGSTGLRVRVDGSQDTVVAGGPDELPGTGAPTPAWLVLGAGTAATAGALLIAGSVRRRTARGVRVAPAPFDTPRPGARR